MPTYSRNIDNEATKVRDALLASAGAVTCACMFDCRYCRIITKPVDDPDVLDAFPATTPSSQLRNLP